MVDFLFVNQPRFNGLPVPREIDCSSPQKDNLMQPLGLMYLAGAVRDAGCSLKFIDANLLNLSYDDVAEAIKGETPLFVVGSMTAPTIYYDNKLAEITKKSSKAFYGTWGAIPSAIREFMFKTFPYLDFIIENEPELTMLALAKNVRDKKNPFERVKGLSYRSGKKVIFNGWRELTPNLNNLPVPYYEGVPMEKYYTPYNRRRPMAVMRTSRGCPGRCIFCITGGQTNLYRGYGMTWRAYSAERALNEIELVVKEYGVREINFFDPEFTIDKKRVQDICKGIIDKKLKVVWNCTARVDLVDEETLKWMKKAGCFGIAYGLESANLEVLKRCKKNITPEQAEKAVAITLKAGIQPSLFFMVGLPGETKESMEESYQFAKKMMLKYGIRPQCTIATPYPGTEFYEIAKAKGWIKEDISSFDQTFAAIEYPGNLTKEDLENFRDRFYRDIILHPSRLIKRIMRIRSLTEIRNIFTHIKEATAALIGRARNIR